MNKYRIDFIPRASWQSGVEPADQRWSTNGQIFYGSEVDATIECSELDAAYDRALTFRAVPLELQPEDEPARYCGGCGGDFQAAPGHQLRCTCKPSVASVAVARAVEVAS